MRKDRGIQALRQARGITQAAVQEACGVSRYTAYLWDQGETMPSTPNLLPLAGLLETSPRELIQLFQGRPRRAA